MFSLTVDSNDGKEGQFQEIVNESDRWGAKVVDNSCDGTKSVLQDDQLNMPKNGKVPEAEMDLVLVVQFDSVQSDRFRGGSLVRNARIWIVDKRMLEGIREYFPVD